MKIATPILSSRRPLEQQSRRRVAPSEAELDSKWRLCQAGRTLRRSNPYGEAFFVGQKDLSYQSARQVVPIVKWLLPIHSVCDVGCGVGTWLRAFLESGVQDIVGIDGQYVDKNLLQIPGSAFRTADLRQPLRLNRSFDLAVSMEVAEHLPESRSVSFVEDLARLAPLVLFSAAIPRQGGTGHINEQWQSHWAGIFTKYDYVTCDVIRPLIWNNTSIARWYRQNILLFCRRDFLPEVQGSKTGDGNALPISVVHPQQYLEIWDELNVRGSLQLLAGALQRAIRRRRDRLYLALRTAWGWRGYRSGPDT
jgi:SAM-dependent methyltransferase